MRISRYPADTMSARTDRGMARKTDRTASDMARKPASKPGKPQREKVQLSLPSATLKRLRIAAAELGVDLSDIVTELIDARYSGVHVRGMNGPSQAEGEYLQQGGSSAPTVRIPGVQSRLNDIARRAHGPIDDALDGIASE